MRYHATITALRLLGSLSARADIILSTSFDGMTVSGATATGFTWTQTNGVQDPVALTAKDQNDDDVPDGLFDPTEDPDVTGIFAPDRNIHNEGIWSVDILLTLLNSDIALGTVSLNAFIVNNFGELQTVNRNLTLGLTLLNSALTPLQPEILVADIYPNNESSVSQGELVSFDLSSNVLSANESYTLRLTASGEGAGNNAGFDNLVVNGDFVSSTVPEPAPLSIMLLGALTVLAGWHQRRRRA